MRGRLWILLAGLFLLILPGITPVPAQFLQNTASQQTPAAHLNGRWRVRFALTGDKEKHLIFDAQDGDTGNFLFMDTDPDDKPVLTPVPAVWSQLSNDRVSISGHVELQLGTCCREVGALVFKGKFTSNSSITGRLIFITNIDEDENPNKFRSKVGTFTASRILN